MTTACVGGGVLQWWTSGNMNTRKRIELNGCRSRGFLVGTTPIAKLTKNASLLMGPRTGRKMRKTFPVSPVMEWQDCSAKIEADVPASFAYDCYSDRESIPNWMSFISSVNVLEDKPDQSRWLLKYSVLGRDVEFSWMARNLQPIRNQKIHWRSLEGLPNRGAVRFFPKDSSSCKVELTVSYEIPQILSPVATALKPACERVLFLGLEKFAAYAKDSYQSKVA
ncbi:hypothetical protein ZOSMA_92G00480 [Zostera marina]|uniref:Coenzyme Q-binding protein COQ10 START domain-containing protein n=1 Tax=Zostera marina TaxID=29655 RepID=A0A0K9NKU3_ZOSMR|nr:hypothetical protein ZOSMA_92G00480 [Zostera marina]